jgi:hypothetical protein
MTPSRSISVGVALGAAVFLAAGSAGAREKSVLMVNGTWVSPLNDKGKVAESWGNGVEMRICHEDEPWQIGIGGFVAIGAEEKDRAARDIYDLRFNVDLKAKNRNGGSLIPFIGIGLDVLNIASHMPSGTTFRGTTLGINARAGIGGWATRSIYYTVGASYLGAIVPGTGDDLGGLVVQLGLGYTLDM